MTTVSDGEQAAHYEKYHGLRSISQMLRKLQHALRAFPRRKISYKAQHNAECNRDQAHVNVLPTGQGKSQSSISGLSDT